MGTKDTVRDHLTPINLHDQDEFQTLQKQRVLCGWNYNASVLEMWCRMMDEKQKALFWIHEPEALQRIGHVSLDCSTDPPNLELANPDKSVMTIATFFILEEYRSKGYARKTMDILEDWATLKPWGSPNCRAIALTTLDRRYLLEDAPEWRGVWSKLGKDPPSTERINEDWYVSPRYRLII